MKILALNSRPRKERGITALILKTFLEGVKETRAEIDLVYVHDFEIKPR